MEYLGQDVESARGAVESTDARMKALAAMKGFLDSATKWAFIGGAVLLGILIIKARES